MDRPHDSAKTQVAVFGGLLILTALTVGAAAVDLGALNLPVAVAIAGGKALLVVLFFMQVRHARKAAQLFSAAGFLWLLILIALTFADVQSRRDGDGVRRSPRSGTR